MEWIIFSGAYSTFFIFVLSFKTYPLFPFMAFRGRKRSSSRYDWYYDKPQKPAIEAGTGIRGGGKFGSTWWGNQWLEAFNNISDSNRLPRGRTYANNGSVRDITIEGNRVQASVQGSRLYKIDITIPKFDAQEQKKIVTLLSERPDLLSRLLNRELPQEVYKICADQDVQLFPRRWNDIKASCSCPDYAMPCKHLAAIIYLIANEIDKDPFQIFDLHGFDLPSALAADGFAAPDTKNQVYATALSSLWLTKPMAPNPTSLDSALLDVLDFSKLTNQRENLAAILPEKPVFYPQGDFKALLKKTWVNIAKQLSKIEKSVDDTTQDFDFQSVETLKIILDDFAAPLRLTALNADDEVVFEAENIDAWISWLQTVPAGQLANLPAGVRALWLAWRFAEALAKQGSMVPQLLDTGGNYFMIRWLPALLNDTVAELYKAFSALVPSDLVQYLVEEKILSADAKDAPLALLSIFLNDYLQKYHGHEGADQPVHQLFFEGLPVTFDRFENKSYPMAIGLWINRFFMAEKDLAPIMEINESGADNFDVSLLIEDKTKPLATPVPLAEVFSSSLFAAQRLDMLRDLSNLGAFFPAINQLLADKGQKPLRYNAHDFATVLFQTLPVIRLFGIQVLLPKSLRHILRPSLSLSLREGPDGKVLSNSGISLNNLLAYDWKVSIGNNYISASEFLALLRNSQGLVNIRGEYVYLDPKETQALAEKLTKPPLLSGPELLQIALSEDYQGSPVQLTAQLRQLISDLLNAPSLPLPTGLAAQLRPYQLRGYEWLYKNARLGFGSVLADDMGLGKTLQVITILLRLKEEGSINNGRRALVVAPTTLLTNWQREISRFAPGLSVGIYHGPTRALKDTQTADVVLSSYGVARTDVAKLDKQAWAILVIDEAQNIKNPNTEQCKAVKKINADIRIAMSGTPVENRLSEYWSIFDFVNKGYLGSLQHFKTNFAIPIEGERDQGVAKRFRKVTQPFVLRRLKTDKSIINDLPDKVEQNQYCNLTPEQAALYQNEVEQTMKIIENSEGIQRRGLVLNLIMSLKQICNHPAQYLKKGKPDPDISGKCPILLDLLSEALANHEKTLIFTQFREMGELLSSMIETQLKQQAPFLHGGLTRNVRDRLVEGFQHKAANRLLIVSLKAGGTGLNLTAASQVIHFDLWWNPAVEAQATDRAFRIGQKRNVQVHRFITAATFEERIDDMIQKKKDLADLTVNAGETWIGDLSNKELRNLFTLGE